MIKQYSNLSKTPTTASLEPTWTTEMERQAELTLLSQTLHLSGDQLELFLGELGVEMAEYERICSKWDRVIEQYKKENSLNV